MIILDYRSGAEKQRDITTVDRMVSNIRQIGVLCEKGALEYGDAAFEGKGPGGQTILVGVERKSLHDILNCIDDARYSAHQKVGMGQMYKASFLIVEGVWRPHNPEGWLMEWFTKGSEGWGYCRYRSRQTLYSKLYRYLLSVSLSGVVVSYSRDLWHTCYDICEIYNYFQKPWEDHTSMLELHKIAIPDMRVKPPLVRKWAAAIDDIGVKMSLAAEDIFKTPYDLACADETDWMRIPRLGVKTARKIIREVRGW